MPTLQTLAPDASLPGSADHNRRAICLLARDIYPVLTGQHAGQPVQQRQSQIARWLMQHGHRVRVITWDHGQPDEQDVDGIRMIKMCRRGSGLPGLRWAHPAWSSLCRALHQADADVYLCDNPGMAFAQMAMWCRGYGRRSVYAPATEADCDASPPTLKAWTERLLHRHGVRLADRIVVTDARQQEIVYDSFGKDAAVVPLPDVCGGNANAFSRAMGQFESLLQEMVS